MKKLLFFSVILSIVLLSANAGASCSLPDLNIPDCIADGVSAGLEKALERSADGLVGAASNMSMNSTALSGSSGSLINNFMVNMLDPSFDPTQIPWVIETRNFTALIYVIIAVMYFTWGGAYHMLSSAMPGIGSEIDWVLGTNYKDFRFSQYAANGIKAFTFPVLGYFILAYLLLIANAFTRLTISDTLSVIIPAKIDPVVYFILALTLFLLAVFMAVRYIVITIFSAFLLIVLGAYLFDEIKPIAAMLLKYLVILIFMPFILAMIAAGGIAFIEGTPWLFTSKPLMYIALGLVMLIAAVVMVFGWRLVSGAVKTAGFVVMKGA